MYKPSSKQAWKGRIDLHDEELGYRWHQVIYYLNLSGEVPHVPEGQKAFAFLGFCCDEGVRRNQGRTGAADGPASFRSAMASFAHHLPPEVLLYDAGDVLCTNHHLEEAQEQLGRKVGALLQQGYRTIVLGGGHETAYGHFLGLEQATQKQHLGILNFDAHFDLRTYDQQSSSGTPFLQIADRLRAQEREFSYKVIGIQQQSNTRILFQTADKLQVNYDFAEQVQGNALSVMLRKLDLWLEGTEAVYVTLDLDVFAAPYAPGVSAINALGLAPEPVLAMLRQVIASGKLVSMDVAELNPALDFDNRTAKLAAGLLYHAVHEWAKV